MPSYTAYEFSCDTYVEFAVLTFVWWFTRSNLLPYFIHFSQVTNLTCAFISP